MSLGISLKRFAPLIGLGVACLWFAAGCALFFGFTADDAFIVLRYAQNLVETGQLVFNPGEYVSALTSPLHALISAVLLQLWDSEGAETANKWLGASCVLVSCLWCAQALFASWSRRLLFCAGTLLSPFVCLWAVGGLETPYLLTAVTAAVTLYVQLRRATARNVRSGLLLFGFACAVALLLRADACLFLAPLWIDVARLYWRKSLAALLVFVSLVGSWYAFALLYFHDPFPTSLYLKLLIKPRPLIDNAAYSGQFLLFSGVIVGAGVALWPRLGKRTHPSPESEPAAVGSSQRPEPAIAVVAIGCAIVLLYSLSHSAQHMFFAFRFFVPYVAAMFVVLASLPTLVGWRAWSLAGACAVGHAVLAQQMLHRGINVTWSALVRGENSEEYDDVSVLEYIGFIEALDRSAEPIRRHWERQQADASLPEPRIAVYTGGLPAWRLPEFRVLEQLVSYRHHCRPDFFEQAHYAQFLRLAPEDEARREKFARLTVERSGALPEVVSREVFFFNDLPFVAEVLFNPRPLPFTLPSYVGGECTP